jgi:hypothetical protein
MKYDLKGKGDAWDLLRYTSDAMAEQGFDKDEIELTMDDAKSSDYNHMLNVLSKAILLCNHRSGADQPDELREKIRSVLEKYCIYCDEDEPGHVAMLDMIMGTIEEHNREENK